MASPVSIRVNFEIGHEASIRTQPTPAGFTHDWEIFLRGADNTDISPFVDKVVFLLHETFQKPKRVFKEPPYSVKESGYAGFNLPIEIYLKNRDEPKKLRFTYDLNLQTTGHTIQNVEKERYIFQNPSEEFRKKLLRGGGVIINHPPSSDHERDSRDCFSDDKHAQLIGKPKLSGDNLKKHRTKEEMPRPSTNFKDLFGPSLQKTIKASPDPKKVSPNIKPEKREKDKTLIDKEKKSKHEHKDKSDKVKINKEDCTKEDKSSKSHHGKEVEKYKEKVMKRPSDRLSPSPASPSKRRCVSPKLSVSPKRTASPGVAPRTHKEDVKTSKHTPPQTDLKKSSQKAESQNVSKYDKKHKKDKKSHDRERDRSPKKEHKKEKESQRESVTKDSSRDSSKFKEEKEKSNTAKESHLPTQKEKQSKSDRPFNKFSIENMLKDPKESTSKNSVQTNSKHKSDSERKHKHKKKDKKRDESRERQKDHTRDKKHKHEKLPVKDLAIHEHKPTTSSQSSDKGNSTPRDKDKPFKERTVDTASPISVDTNSQSSSKSSRNFKSKDASGSTINLSENSDSESGASIVSEDESTTAAEIKPTVKLEPAVKLEPKEEFLTPKVESMRVVNSEPAVKVEKPSTLKEEKTLQILQKEKSSKKSKEKSRHESKDDKKRKRKSDDPKPGETVRTETKLQDNGVSSSLGGEAIVGEGEADAGGESAGGEGSAEGLTADYMLQLKELQHRIMTIQCNAELERVVNLIAATGKYEVTKKTFDFDLCLLDRSTVQRLIELIGQAQT